MRLVKNKDRAYVLVTNAEKIEFKEGHNYWKYMHGDLKYFIDPRGYTLPNIREEEQVNFIGKKGCMPAKVIRSHFVHRITPYEISARSYWGEFRRTSMYSRQHKMIFDERSIILECVTNCSSEEMIERYISEFTGYQPLHIHPNHFSPMRAGINNNKMWNLTLDRNLGPNLSDYSTNDCFKYYTLLV